MGAEKPGVAPGVELTKNFRVKVDFEKVLEWWQKEEEAVYQKALATPDQLAEDPRIRIAWGLILAGLDAAGFQVDQVEETWNTTG